MVYIKPDGDTKVLSAEELAKLRKNAGEGVLAPVRREVKRRSSSGSVERARGLAEDVRIIEEEWKPKWGAKKKRGGAKKAWAKLKQDEPKQIIDMGET